MTKLGEIAALAFAALMVCLACAGPSGAPVATSEAAAPPATTPTSEPVPDATTAPATPPATTPTSEPTPSATTEAAAPSEPVTDAEDQVGTPPTESIETLLSGDALARYQALPPAFRTALDAYLWFHVAPERAALAAADKMEQWGDAAIPLGEIIGEERAERFHDPNPEAYLRSSEPIALRHANLLLSGYVYTLNSEMTEKRRRALMRELADDPLDLAPESLASVEVPPIDKILTKTALARLEEINPHISRALLALHTVPEFYPPEMHGKAYPTVFRQLAFHLTFQEMFLLKAEPDLGPSAIDSYISGDILASFEALSPDARAFAVFRFQQDVATHLAFIIATTPLGVDTDPLYDYYKFSAADAVKDAEAFARERVKPGHAKP